jgi:hypothetical protein
MMDLILPAAPVGKFPHPTLSAGIDPVREEWHLDVIQAQFIDAVAREEKHDFMRTAMGWPTSGRTTEERGQQIRLAVAILIKHGRRARVPVFWFPTIWAEIALATGKGG